MRRMLAAAILGLMAAPAVAQPAPPVANPAPADPARLELARQIIAMAYPGDAAKTLVTPMVTRMMDVMRANMRTPPGFDDPGLKTILDDFLTSLPQRIEPTMERHLPLLLDAIGQSYARTFSTEDLQATLAFARTPAGTHYFQRAATLMADPAVTAELGSLVRDSQATNMAAAQDFQQKVKAYLAAHPDVAARLKATAANDGKAPAAGH